MDAQLEPNPTPIFKAVLASVFEYRSEDDRKNLKALQCQLQNEFGEEADFKDPSTLIRYFNKLDEMDVTPNAAQLVIDEIDVVVPDVEADPYNIESPRVNDSRGDRVHINDRNIYNLKVYEPDWFKKLREENPDILDGEAYHDLRCKICSANLVSMTLVPCGHLVVCTSCVNLIGATCPLCEQAWIGYFETQI